MNTVEETLEQRETRYGDFLHQSRIAQAIKCAMHNSQNWAYLAQDKKEALDMIAGKIARILNGDPEYADSWHDIAGYATLAEQNCANKEE